MSAKAKARAPVRKAVIRLAKQLVLRPVGLLSRTRPGGPDPYPSAPSSAS